MTTDYADIVNELRLLAKAVLERAEPVMKLVASTSPAGAHFVSTLESIANGENTDFADQFAAQGSKLIAQLRGFLEGGLSSATAKTDPEDDATPTAQLPETASPETAARHAASDSELARDPVGR